jgi:hypothetical protein
LPVVDACRDLGAAGQVQLADVEVAHPDVSS